MSRKILIFHLGFVLTAHSATRKLLCFWCEWLVITRPILFPDLLVDPVELLECVQISFVSFKKFNFFQLDVERVFKIRHCWIFVRETQNKSGVWGQVPVTVKSDSLSDSICQKPNCKCSSSGSLQQKTKMIFIVVLERFCWRFFVLEVYLTSKELEYSRTNFSGSCVDLHSLVEAGGSLDLEIQI
jgi:hypothetical protein